jgi:hypothetical protein
MPADVAERVQSVTSAANSTVDCNAAPDEPLSLRQTTSRALTGPRYAASRGQQPDGCLLFTPQIKFLVEGACSSPMSLHVPKRALGFFQSERAFAAALTTLPMVAALATRSSAVDHERSVTGHCTLNAGWRLASVLYVGDDRDLAA